MRDEYDFSNARRNPFLRGIKPSIEQARKAYLEVVINERSTEGEKQFYQRASLLIKDPESFTKGLSDAAFAEYQRALDEIMKVDLAREENDQNIQHDNG